MTSTPAQTKSRRSRIDPLAALLARPLDELPARIRDLVEAETRRSDIVSAWVLLAIVSFLGLLYLVSPKALDGMTQLQPVPVAVGLLIAGSVLRLWLAYAGYTTKTVVFLFTIADFSLFYALVWSFHIQYGQIAAFSLKAPTFLFVFLLIAVRALRLEPMSVVFAGAVAAFGWAVLALLAIDQSPPGTITRDFTTYLTTNSILVGAEIEKIVAILLVTFVLTLAILRARRQLVAAAAGQTAREDLSRFLPADVANRITLGDERIVPGHGEIVSAGIVVSDIRGFTAFAGRHEPDRVMRLLLDYQSRFANIIAAKGGSIDKFLGDGILATFGCSRPIEMPAADALRAGLALAAEGRLLMEQSEARDQWPLVTGIAVTSGPILFGAVGNNERLEFTVIGEAVNLAVKLEKLNKALNAALVVDGATFAAALAQGFIDEGRFELAASRHVEGLSEPVDIYYLPRA